MGFRCGVPPRQTQTDNDASGSPPRVAGRPTLLLVLLTSSIPDGLERLWDGPYGIAVRRWERKRSQIAKKYTAHGRTVGASRAFSVRQVMTVRNGKTVAETDRSRGEARQRDFITAHSSIMAGFYEPRATNHYFFTSRGLLEAMSLFWVCCREAAFESEATGGLRTATGGADRPQSTLTNP